jgi:ABC-type phosphate transport system substrate-binding protein
MTYGTARRALGGLAAAVLFTGLLAGLLPGAQARAQDFGFVVVANPEVGVDRLSTDDLGRIFKKELTRWPDGTPIRPVELGGTSPARAEFYGVTLRLRVGDVTAYWINQAMTTGSNPPKVFSSPNLVMRYVSQTPGAVGFVSADTPIDPQVKQIAVE